MVVHALHRPELVALSIRYALAADQRDAGAFADVFDHDGVLRLTVPFGSRPATLRGDTELATVPRALERYLKTLHIIGTAGYSDGDVTATGQVYCVAHHVKRVNDTYVDHVMHIRYVDSYRWSVDRAWSILERVVHVEWSHRRVVETHS